MYFNHSISKPHVVVCYLLLVSPPTTHPSPHAFVLWVPYSLPHSSPLSSQVMPVDYKKVLEAQAAAESEAA